MQIVLASGNQNKLKELSSILAPLNWDIKPQSDFNVPEADETGLSFIENAILKARNAAQHTQLPAIADDSGICVNALNGAPGIYSARYSATETSPANDASNNAKLLEALSNTPDDKRSAFFFCALAFVQHAEDPTPLIITAQWHGRILHALQGENGFGYDPLFFVEEHQCSSAELDYNLKNKISHRGQAMEKLLPALKAHLHL